MREYQQKERQTNKIIKVPISYYEDLRKSLTEETDLDKYSSKKYLIDYLIDVRIIKIVKASCQESTQIGLDNLTPNERIFYDSLKENVDSFKREVYYEEQKN